METIVVINKIDRPGATPEKVVDQVIELFIELEASDEQLDFPIVYVDDEKRIATSNFEEEAKDLNALYNIIRGK